MSSDVASLSSSPLSSPSLSNSLSSDPFETSPLPSDNETNTHDGEDDLKSEASLASDSPNSLGSDKSNANSSAESDDEGSSVDSLSKLDLNNLSSDSSGTGSDRDGSVESDSSDHLHSGDEECINCQYNRSKIRTMQAEIAGLKRHVALLEREKEILQGSGLALARTRPSTVARSSFSPYPLAASSIYAKMKDTPSRLRVASHVNRHDIGSRTYVSAQTHYDTSPTTTRGLPSSVLSSSTTAMRPFSLSSITTGTRPLSSSSSYLTTGASERR